MNTAQQQHHYSNIQALRGIAALLVVAFHLYAVEGKYFAGHIVPAFLGICGMSGVDLFFVISGFVMVTISRGTFGAPGAAPQFLLRRAVRIYPIYWFYSLIVLAVMLVKPQWVNATMGHRADVLASLTLFPSHTLPLLMQGWTLTFEVFFYLVFALLIRWAAERMLPVWLCVWAMLTMIAFARLPAGSAVVGVVTDPLVLEFIGGCFAALSARRLAGRLALACVGVGVILFIVASVFAMREPVDVILRWRALCFGLPSFFVVLGLAAAELKLGLVAPRVLSHLGDASYSLYLSHVLVLSAVGRFWAHFGGGSLVGAAVGSVICGAAATAFGWWSYRFIERPLNAAIRAALAAREAPAVAR